jgi:hypothetical protein
MLGKQIHILLDYFLSEICLSLLLIFHLKLCKCYARTIFSLCRVTVLYECMCDAQNTLAGRRLRNPALNYFILRLVIKLIYWCPLFATGSSLSIFLIFLHIAMVVKSDILNVHDIYDAWRIQKMQTKFWWKNKDRYLFGDLRNWLRKCQSTALAKDRVKRRVPVIAAMNTRVL